MNTHSIRHRKNKLYNKKHLLLIDEETEQVLAVMAEKYEISKNHFIRQAINRNIKAYEKAAL